MSQCPIVICSCQSAITADLGRYMEYQLSSGGSELGGKHVLLSGPESTGKTSIAFRVASRLFRGPLAVFSLRLDCRTLRGTWSFLILKSYYVFWHKFSVSDRNEEQYKPGFGNGCQCSIRSCDNGTIFAQARKWRT